MAVASAFEENTMVDRNRLREELRTMRELIKKDAEVCARFDLDGNGMIDGDEWDQVCQLVTRRLEREGAEAERSVQLLAAAGEGTPLAPAAAATGSIAQGIYDSDLPSSSGSTPASTRIEAATELILEQQGGLAQICEQLFRRRYAVLAADGTVLAEVQQVENEMLQNLTNSSIFSQPDLSFQVTVAATGESITFRRSSEFLAEQVVVLDSSGGQQAIVHWKASLVGKKFRISGSMDPGTLQVKSSIFKPFTLTILGALGNEIGTIERGWSGLGALLTGGNRMRIKLDQPVSNGQLWGLLAASLLADLGDERDRD